jgi:hypothetical protein
MPPILPGNSFFEKGNPVSPGFFCVQAEGIRGQEEFPEIIFLKA